MRCYINCSGGCPACAPDEHTIWSMVRYWIKHNLTFKGK